MSRSGDNMITSTRFDPSKIYCINNHLHLRIKSVLSDECFGNCLFLFNIQRSWSTCQEPEKLQVVTTVRHGSNLQIFRSHGAPAMFSLPGSQVQSLFIPLFLLSIRGKIPKLMSDQFSILPSFVQESIQYFSPLYFENFYIPSFFHT